MWVPLLGFKLRVPTLLRIFQHVFFSSNISKGRMDCVWWLCKMISHAILKFLLVLLFLKIKWFFFFFSFFLKKLVPIVNLFECYKRYCIKNLTLFSQISCWTFKLCCCKWGQLEGVVACWVKLFNHHSFHLKRQLTR